MQVIYNIVSTDINVCVANEVISILNVLLCVAYYVYLEWTSKPLLPTIVFAIYRLGFY